MSSVQVQQPVALEVTAAAARKVRRLVDEEGNSQLKLRVFVTGGGCSGFLPLPPRRGQGFWGGEFSGGVFFRSMPDRGRSGCSRTGSIPGWSAGFGANSWSLPLIDRRVH